MPKAVETARTGHGLVVAGHDYDRSDPRVKACPHLFGSVEAATSAPGEKRDVVPPSSRKSCDVEGCDYEGTSHGLSIHAARSH